MATTPLTSRVSIILPTYNRAGFLPQAFASIQAQTHQDWELIVVDDGSTDNTAELVERLATALPGRVKYRKQANQGAYGARNTGLDLVTGDYVAFYDSDDLWLPPYLEHCVRALSQHADLDWVYGACRTVNFSTSEVLAPTTFEVSGQPRPFRQLPAERRGDFHVLPAHGLVECALLHGLYCGLQNSVIRRRVFERERFLASDRNEAEDQVFVIRVIKAGFRLAYFEEVVVQYHVHESNSSGSATGRQTLDRQRRLLEPVARGFEALARLPTLTASERRALGRRLNRELFWHLGYSVFWQHGLRREALASYRRGLRAWPWSLRCWKTYLAALLRTRHESETVQ